jgi:hypothetical protein
MALSRRFLKRSVVTVIALAVLVLNPVFGVLSRPDFGAAEMRAAVEGTWQLTVASPGAPPRTITFTLAQGDDPAEPTDPAEPAKPRDAHAAWSLVRPAAACGHRSLVKTAGACRDVTDMPLEVTVIAGGGPQRQPARGMFSVTGNRFDAGYLRVSAGGVELDARLTVAGEVRDVSSYVPEERAEAPRPKITSTLIRTKR